MVCENATARLKIIFACAVHLERTLYKYIITLDLRHNGHHPIVIFGLLAATALRLYFEFTAWEGQSNDSNDAGKETSEGPGKLQQHSGQCSGQ